VKKSPLSGKHALVTGGSSGLGRAFARALAREGAAVCVVARGEAGLRDVVAELRADGGQADYHVCDLTELPALYDLIDVFLARFKRLDILVNNAGTGVRAPLLGTRRADIAEAIDVNLRSPIYLAQAALPALLRSAPSDLVNVASVMGLHASAEATVYCATQFGLVGFSRALSLELRPARVRVTTLCPGSVETPFFDRFESAADPRDRLSSDAAAQVLIDALKAPADLVHEEIAFYHR
jgi:NAD(P)-dependent dehydrogenase (short-subunit alcohol dehydrogenase family)